MRRMGTLRFFETLGPGDWYRQQSGGAKRISQIARGGALAASYLVPEPKLWFWRWWSKLNSVKLHQLHQLHLTFKPWGVYPCCILDSVTCDTRRMLMLWLQLHNLLHMLKRWGLKKQDWRWSLQTGQNYNFCKKVIQKMLSDVDVVLQMQLFDSSHWWSIWLLRVIFLRSNGWATNFHPEAVDFFAAVGQRNNGQGDFERPVIWRKFICRSFRVAMLKVVKMKQYFDEHCQVLVIPRHVKHTFLFWGSGWSLWDWESAKLSWWHLILKSAFCRCLVLGMKLDFSATTPPFCHGLKPVVA